jgi:phage shock protein A
MDVNTIWSAILSAMLAGLWFFIREKLEDIKRVERLLNITREEIARDYATNSEVQRVTDHIDQRFNRLEAKIDQLIQAKNG